MTHQASMSALLEEATAVAATRHDLAVLAADTNVEEQK